VPLPWGKLGLRPIFIQERHDYLDQTLQESLEVLIIPAKYHYLSGNFREAQTPLKQICERFQQEDPARLPANDVQKFIYALAAHFLGNIYLKQSKVGQAFDLLQRSEIAGRSVEAWTHVAMALNTLGNAYIQRRRHGDLDEAIKHLEESARLASDDKTSLAKSLNTLGNAFVENENYLGAIKPLLIAEAFDTNPNSRAKTWLKKIPSIITTHNAKMLGPVYFLMGQAYEKVDDLTRAIESYEMGEAINRGPGGNLMFADNMHRRAEKLKSRQAQKKE
jgi:tetratricopeptide (TPR) repeat protein